MVASESVTLPPGVFAPHGAEHCLLAARRHVRRASDDGAPNAAEHVDERAFRAIDLNDFRFDHRPTDPEVQYHKYFAAEASLFSRPSVRTFNLHDSGVNHYEATYGRDRDAGPTSDARI